MQTQNLETLKIHKLTKAQYERELEDGNIDENALYLTPDTTTEQLATKADLVHTHAIDDVTDLQSTLDIEAAALKTYTDSYFFPVSTSNVSTGSAYTITVDYIDVLNPGASFIMIPNVVSTSTTPTLDVNGFGAKQIRRKLSTNTGTAVAGSSVNWLTKDKPIRVTYDGTYWIADITRPSATDMYGVLPIASGGTGASSASAALTKLGAMADVSVTTDDVGKFLRVNSSGAWAAETISNKVLWSGEWDGNYNSSVTLSDAVTSQVNGVVLVFSAYDESESSVKDVSWNEIFIPKQAITYGTGKLRVSQLTIVEASGDNHVMRFGFKWLYLTDTTISGNSFNVSSNTMNGVTYTNNKFVLRYVIGM